MSSVTKSIDVDAPISQVYNQWTQFETFPSFMGGVESITQLDDRRQHWTVSVAGVQREFDTEVTEQHPEERVAWRSTDGTTHAGVVTFHKLSQDQTKVTVQLDWKPSGVLETAGAVVGLDDHQVSSDLSRFKQFIEDRDTETGAWRGDIPRES